MPQKHSVEESNAKPKTNWWDLTCDDDSVSSWNTPRLPDLHCHQKPSATIDLQGNLKENDHFRLRHTIPRTKSNSPRLDIKSKPEAGEFSTQVRDSYTSHLKLGNNEEPDLFQSRESRDRH